MANKQAVGFDHNGELDPRKQMIPSPSNTEEAVVALRLALGMCIQVMLQESLGGPIQPSMKEAVREEAIRTNVSATRFDPRFQRVR